MTAGVVLLAGGSASRFGSDKRLRVLADGRTLLMAALDSIRRAELPLLVCLGAADHDLELTLRHEGIHCTRCPDSRQGMGATLANGIGAVAQSWDGVLVGLADMPSIRPDTYLRIRDQLRANRIVIPTHGGKRGHPVGFDRGFFPELLALEGDRGARGVLSAHPEAVLEIAVDDPGILLDVDVVADLQSLPA